MCFSCSRSNVGGKVCIVENTAGYAGVRCYSSPCEFGFWYSGVIQKNLCCLFITSVKEFTALKEEAVLQIHCSSLFLCFNH